MEIINFLLSVRLEDYTFFVYAWASLGIVAGIAIYFLKLMPISGKVDNHTGALLGSVNKKLGWIIMETPILVSVCYFYFAGKNPINPSIVIVGFFVLHYANRALIFPHRIKTAGKRIPTTSILLTMSFYTINGYLIGYYFGSLKTYPIEWLYDPLFILGSGLFVFGFIVNIKSDNILINLRGPNESGYKIPQGGFFKYVSCPNYFGEILEWIGFAIMCWSIPGVMYALWVGITLLTTGLGAHRWYLEKFGEEYPKKRKAVLPFIL
jgi:protein-S-isoprenylcysteine O-methyltransferase Ste14